jgi:protein-tyrosine-phosphatase
MADLPGSVLFCCTLNSVRSPMAEAIMKHFYGHQTYVDSVGVRRGDVNEFAIAVMDEIGIDLSGHQPKAFDELEDTSFDLIVSLTPEAQHGAVELTRTLSAELEYWPTLDPSAVPADRRELILDAYRQLRDSLMKRIQERFSQGPPPTT